MSESGFWDDQDNAAKVSAEHSRAARRLEEFATLQTDVEDLESLAEMAREDPEIEAELEGQLAPVERAWRRSRSSACSPGATTTTTRSSPSTPAPAGPTPRTGPRWSCACR